MPAGTYGKAESLHEGCDTSKLQAHKLKNDRSQLYAAALHIRTKLRYLLTGTVMQASCLSIPDAKSPKLIALIPVHCS